MQDFKNFLIAKYVDAKFKMESFFKGEKGEANIIAVILVLAIVIALVLIFRKNITQMVDSIWEGMQGDWQEMQQQNPVEDYEFGL
ncbi:MAG: hypothetical protein IJO03_01110 [Clostridia bacterium]|nr:hypothetical protein [Clostridia bacterium]